MAREFSRDEILAELRDEFGENLDEARFGVNRILERGDGVAVYQNADLTHPEIGRRLTYSFGSKAAQFEDIQSPDDLPTTLPDGLAQHITGGINWRYQLVGTYRGEKL